MKRSGALLLAAGISIYAPAANALCAAPEKDALRKAILGTSSTTYYTAVFIGVVQKVFPARETTVDDAFGEPEGKSIWTPSSVHVEYVFQGRVADSVRFMSQGGMPPGGKYGLGVEDQFSFTRGGRYLFEAHRNSDGTYSTNACSQTQRLSAAGAARLISIYGAKSAPSASPSPATPSPSPVAARPTAGRRTGASSGGPIAGLVAAALLSLAIRQMLVRTPRGGRA
jgi:hypothetical protein